MNCSEKYGNDLPTAIRSDVGRNEDSMTVDIVMSQNATIPPSMVNSMPTTIPMTEYVDSSNTPLPPKLDNQGSFTLPPMSTTTTGGAGTEMGTGPETRTGMGGGAEGIHSQNSVLHRVRICPHGYISWTYL